MNLVEVFEKYEEELNKVSSVEEAIEMLKSKGVEVSLEDFQKLAAAVVKNGELDEGELEGVAGGRKVSSLFNPLEPIKTPSWLKDLLKKGLSNKAKR